MEGLAGVPSGASKGRREGERGDGGVCLRGVRKRVRGRV